ncbi:hypothetical protein AUR64_14895 [Haloprofundus marisrubri]|uniref:Uncharacterized protein n=1 Tax=Haloprofundus marisrubri TaxID=1514971 RepID=A0A0W1R6M7_9EURY|nr:hypothetical protein [Haloprofundus marisrubri]KTG09083.1 hypothetical protein AUR64_14895 [Haloprofundus marisrubri]
MQLLTGLFVGLGLVTVGLSFLRLLRTNRTDAAYLRVIEGCFAAVLVVSGFGLMFVALLG